MNRRTIQMTVAALVTGCAFGIASAKLPSPNEEQKAKAAEAKSKAGEAAKRQAELLGKAQDRATENYKRRAIQKTGGAAPMK